MSRILTPNQVNQPRIVTLAELKEKLQPLCYGNRWALGTIVDLWKKGAPVPVEVGQEERRILLPGQFQKWWNDLNSGLGFNVTGAEQYRQVSHGMATNNATRTNTRRRGQRAGQTARSLRRVNNGK